VTAVNDHSVLLQAYAKEQMFMLGEREYHADDHVVGQYYIALAEEYNLPEALVPVTQTFDKIIMSPSSVSLNFSIDGAHSLYTPFLTYIRCSLLLCVFFLCFSLFHS
jgi:hypothetical protein